MAKLGAGELLSYTGKQVSVDVVEVHAGKMSGCEDSPPSHLMGVITEGTPGVAGVEQRLGSGQYTPVYHS